MDVKSIERCTLLTSAVCPIICSMDAMLWDPLVVCKRRRSTTLAILIMRKKNNTKAGFYEYGAPLGGPTDRRCSAMNSFPGPRFDSIWNNFRGQVIDQFRQIGIQSDRHQHEVSGNNYRACGYIPQNLVLMSIVWTELNYISKLGYCNRITIKLKFSSVQLKFNMFKLDLLASFKCYKGRQ